MAPSAGRRFVYNPLQSGVQLGVVRGVFRVTRCCGRRTTSTLTTGSAGHRLWRDFIHDAGLWFLPPQEGQLPPGQRRLRHHCRTEEWGDDCREVYTNEFVHDCVWNQIITWNINRHSSMLRWRLWCLSSTRLSVNCRMSCWRNHDTNKSNLIAYVNKHQVDDNDVRDEHQQPSVCDSSTLICFIGMKTCVPAAEQTETEPHCSYCFSSSPSWKQEKTDCSFRFFISIQYRTKRTYRLSDRCLFRRRSAKQDCGKMTVTQSHEETYLFPCYLSRCGQIMTTYDLNE